jgi:hypothetical protein
MSDRDERLWARCHADGMRLFRAGCDAEAERALHQAVRHAEVGGVDGARLACTLYQLAELAQVGHHWAEAERLYQRALAAEVAELGADHPYVATVLRSQARLLRRVHREVEAQALEQRAEAIWRGERRCAPVQRVA